MAERKLKNGLTFQIVDLPVPILRHPKWVEIKYSKSLREEELINFLEQSLKEAERFAKKAKAKQIKIATSPFWKKLKEVGLERAVYYMTNEAIKLAKINAKNYALVGLLDPSQVKNLIKDQFLYHCRYKPLYFTCEIESHVRWFIDLAKESIKKKESFLLGAKRNKKIVGFLYGEFYKNEGCIDELFVEEKSRGEGIGKFLVKMAAKRFLKREVRKIGLFTGIDRKFWGFYEKLGFQKRFVNWVKNL